MKDFEIVNHIKNYKLRDIRDNKTYPIFFISRDLLNRKKLSKADIAKRKENGCTAFFKLYDDDDILYFEGYLNDSLPKEVTDELEDIEFAPLDWAMNDSGCTRIDYRNKKTGKMETL